MKLTPEQISQFHERGYIYVGEILDATELEEAREAFQRIFDSKPRSFRDLGLQDSETGQQAAILQVLNIYQLDEIFRRTECRPDVVDAVESLLDTPAIRLYGDQALFKPPKHGSRVLWHQDNGYWQLEPANVVSMWLALDDADDSNGCMRVLPGSHKWGLLDHAQSTENEELRGIEVNEDDVVSVHVPAGHAMMHHCLTVHGTQANHSARPRRAVAITYMQADALQRGEPMTEFPLLRGSEVERSSAEA